MSIPTVNPLGAQTLTNYGGRTPTPQTTVKQFYQNDSSNITWYYKNSNNQFTLTPTVQSTSLDVVIPGNLTVNGCINGQFCTPSDIQLKENIQDIKKEEIEKILDLEPKKYNLKNNSDKKEHYGFVAQDLQLLFPTLIEEIAGKKHVNYLELIPLMIAKMKQMQEQIDYLIEYKQNKQT